MSAALGSLSAAMSAWVASCSVWLVEARAAALASVSTRLTCASRFAATVGCMAAVSARIAGTSVSTRASVVPEMAPSR